MKLWTSLMFLHGHIADPALARSLAADDAPAAAQAPPATRTRGEGGTHRTRPRSGMVARLLHNLEYLGGRPMTAGHNVDIEEPFTHAAARVAAKRGNRSRPCVTRRGAIAAVCGAVALSPFR